MPIEIERKFLVKDAHWRSAVSRTEAYRQGYLASTAECSVRVRVGGTRGWLTIKGRLAGSTRLEYEYVIPAGEAHEILDRLCDGARLEKHRHWVPFAGREWEVDEFVGDNAGLVVAELELDRADEAFELPPWLGHEVTDELRYYNASLARRPYRAWSAAEREPSA